MSEPSVSQEFLGRLARIKTKIVAERDQARKRQADTAEEIRKLKEQIDANPNPGTEDWTAVRTELDRIEINVQQIVTDSTFPDEDMDGLPDHNPPPGAARRG